MASGVGLAAITSFIISTYFRTSDHTRLSTFGWLVFGLSGLVAPLVLAWRTQRQLQQVMTHERKVITDALVSFIALAWTTVVIALTLR